MNRAGDAYEWAVRYSHFWDGVERVSGSAAAVILIFTVGYVTAALIRWCF
jgi:hypothetical protein